MFDMLSPTMKNYIFKKKKLSELLNI